MSSHTVEWRFAYQTDGTWTFEIDVDGATANIGSAHGNSIDSIDVTFSQPQNALGLKVELEHPNTLQARWRTSYVSAYIDQNRGQMKGSGKGIVSAVKGAGKGSGPASSLGAPATGSEGTPAGLGGSASGSGGAPTGLGGSASGSGTASGHGVNIRRRTSRSRTPPPVTAPGTPP